VDIFNNVIEYIKWYHIHEKIYESEKRAIKALDLRNCLDIGSGPGVFKDVLGDDSIFLDLSEMMLKETKEGYKVQAEAHFLPFRDKSINCSFVSVTICFLSNLEDFLKEIERVTRNYIGICIIPKDSPWGKYYVELGNRGHKYYSKAKFLTKKELYILISKFFNIEKIVSTITYNPWEEERVEDPKEDDSGSFLCLKASIK
jgi:ubiquinone/menaquinone biosynthesis C-methylase UbiE